MSHVNKHKDVKENKSNTTIHNKDHQHSTFGLCHMLLSQLPFAPPLLVLVELALGLKKSTRN